MDPQVNFEVVDRDTKRRRIETSSSQVTSTTQQVNIGEMGGLISVDDRTISNEMVSPDFIPLQDDSDTEYDYEEYDHDPSDDEEVPTLKCAICMDDKPTSRTYESFHGHPYPTCIECIWRIMREQGSCPYCRSKIRARCTACTGLKSISELAFNVHNHITDHMCPLCLIKNRHDALYHCGSYACAAYVPREKILMPMNFREFEVLWLELQNTLDTLMNRLLEFGNMHTTASFVARFRRDYFGMN